MSVCLCTCFFFYLLSIYFYCIFKCGLHYLAMIKLFQRIVFACLTKEFLHVLAILYIAMVKFFVRFSSLNSVSISSRLN